MQIGIGTGQNARATWRGHPARRLPYRTLPALGRPLRQESIRQQPQQPLESNLNPSGPPVGTVNGLPNIPIVVNNSFTFYCANANNFSSGRGPIMLGNNATVTLQLGQSPNLTNPINNNGYNLSLINTQDGGTITVQIPRSNAVGDKLFARLKATQP